MRERRMLRLGFVAGMLAAIVAVLGLTGWLVGRPYWLAYRAVERLIEVARRDDGDRDRRIRLASEMIISVDGGRPTVPFLRRSLGHGSPAVRRAAAYAIGEIGSDADAAVPRLMEAAHDDDARVRWVAIEALGSIGPNAAEAADSLVTALPDQSVSAVAAAALKRIGAAAVPALVDALARGDSETRKQVCMILRGIGPDARPAVPSLVAATQHSSAIVRFHAVVALVHIDGDSPEVIAALGEVSRHDKDESVRWWAAEHLKERGGELAERAAVR